MGFRSLQHTKVRRSTTADVAFRPLRSALRVWLPSRRLTPSEPVPVLFHTGGARGICPAELSPLGRYPLRFRSGRTHVPFNPPVLPSRKRWAGPAGRGFWASALPGVPGDRRRVSTTTAGCSLGLHPSRASGRKPGPGSHPDSSHALSRASTLRPNTDGASEYRSVFAWPHPPIPASRNRRMRQPF